MISKKRVGEKHEVGGRPKVDRGVKQCRERTLCHVVGLVGDKERRKTGGRFGLNG